jgi:hypothetical protein
MGPMSSLLVLIPEFLLCSMLALMFAKHYIRAIPIAYIFLSLFVITNLFSALMGDISGLFSALILVCIIYLVYKAQKQSNVVI